MQTKRRQQFHYCILYSQVIKQWEVYRTIKKSLPEDRGLVFYPCVELWWNDTVQTVIRPLFPGYIFIRSNLSREELHMLIRQKRGEIFSVIKELKLSETRLAGEDSIWDKGFGIEDLNDEEAEFFDFLLNFREESDGDHVPDAGVIRMSRGYMEHGRVVIMEGPLKGFEERITGINKRKRKAYLDIGINGCICKAGLEIFGKKHWFPDDKDAAVTLEDGTEIDPKELARMMMSGKDTKS